MTDEAIFFFEQVTGHLIPDVRPMLKDGIKGVKARIEEKLSDEHDEDKINYYQAMNIALDSALVFASRYADIAHEKANNSKVE